MKRITQTWKSRSTYTAAGLASAFFLATAMDAGATAVTAADYNDINRGSQYASQTSTMTDASGEGHGDLAVSVYELNGLYTYELTLDPTVDNVSQFSVDYSLAAFNGIAGFCSDDTGGAPEDAFSIYLDDNDSTMLFADTDRTWDWNAGTSITFFFQSTDGTLGGQYSMINSVIAATVNNPAPVSEPATMLLFGSGIALMGISFKKSKVLPV